MFSQRQAGGKGFTPAELLISTGIIVFLAMAILVAVDPVKRIQDARNAERWTEINAVLNAVLNKQVDESKPFNGSPTYPIIDGSQAQIIVSTDTGLADCAAKPPSCPGFAAGLNLSSAVSCFANLNPAPDASGIVPKYLPEIPVDPVGEPEYSASNTGYYINRNNGRIEIGACSPEQMAIIRVKK